MSVKPTKCNHLSVLKPYLGTVAHTLESKPNGQNKYTFEDGLVLNLYETTGKVVFQGKGSGSDFAIQVNEMIDTINKIPVHKSEDEDE
ncbi:MAG: hypothetical protein ACK4VV_12000 [Pseudomonas sp.]